MTRPTPGKPLTLEARARETGPVFYGRIILLPREIQAIGVDTLAAACEEGRIRKVQ